jgi:glycerophosphoryl diester phosphodiesterase
VCLHDETCGSIRVSESSLQDLIDALDDLLLFDDFLALLDEHDPERHTVVHLDLKDRGYELEAVDALLKERRPFFVTTLEAPSISLLRRERPDVAALLTIGRGWKGLSRWQQLRIHAVHVPFVPLWRTKATGVAVNFRLYRWPLKQWTKWRHLSVVVWTVDGSAALRTLLSDDSVDVVTTNYPVKALAIRDELWGKLSG